MDALSILQRTLEPIQIDVVREQLKLPDEPMRYDLPSEKILIMLFAARTGSTYAGQLLAHHPDFGGMAEWCNPARLDRTCDQTGLSNHGEALQHLIDTQAKRVFAVECSLVGIVSAALLGFLDQCLPRATFMILRRRDTVAQAVSIQKARLSRQFGSNQKPAREINEDEFDYEQIAHHRDIVRGVYHSHEEILTALGRSAETYFYEDVVADPDAFQSSVYANLGVAQLAEPTVSTRVQKISDEINEAWIARFNEIEGRG